MEFIPIVITGCGYSAERSLTWMGACIVPRNSARIIPKKRPKNGRHGWTHRHSDGRGWGCACARVCAYVRACVRDVFAIYDDNILPRLIMIIKISTGLYPIIHTNQTH